MIVSISYLHPGQKAENTLKVLNAAKNRWPDDGVIQIMAGRIETAAGELISAYTDWSTKEHTLKVNDADSERDNACRYLFTMLKGHIFSQSQEISDKAGVLVRTLFNDNLDILIYAFAEESVHIKNLLDSCVNMKADLETLGLWHAVERLQTSQNEFEKVYSERSGHLENKPANVLSKIKPFDQILRSFLTYLEATYPEEDIKTVCDPLLRLKPVRHMKKAAHPE